jgi:predicted flavoprotein YhiN
VRGATGDGVTIGRDSGSRVSPVYGSQVKFEVGTIDRVVVDVAGAPFVDHEKEVFAYLTPD